jgi:4-hydroxy-3-polyprenylbenzoate decarboxylase
MKVVISISGASGVIYGIRLLEVLKAEKGEKFLIISSEGKELIAHETNYKLANIKNLATRYWENDELSAPIASGSFKFDSMVIVPCSLSTLSKIAGGIADNLTTRAASICLKERRKLILVPRETPLSNISLQNMLELSRSGCIILPAMPAFYPKPKSIGELVDFVVGRILDQLGIENKLYKRWKGG